MTDLEARQRPLILVPVYNDWDAFRDLLRGLEHVLRDASLTARVLAVDDGSSDRLDEQSILESPYRAISEVNVLRLGRNVGHQRAIAIALAHVAAVKDFDVVVIMDADGQDRPEDVPRLIADQSAHPESIVFARRASRSEGRLFSFCYWCFKILFRMLTGSAISFGNFSAIPASAVRRLVLVSELWNHYPASVVKARLPFRTLPIDRGARTRGVSKMNFSGLVSHGLSAVSVHGDMVGVRALLVTTTLIVASLLLLGGVVAIRMTTDWAIPGWASYLAASLSIVLLQAVMLSVFFVMIVLSSRKLTDVILQRDYAYFVLDEVTVFSTDEHELVSGIGAGTVPARP